MTATPVTSSAYRLYFERLGIVPVVVASGWVAAIHACERLGMWQRTAFNGALNDSLGAFLSDLFAGTPNSGLAGFAIPTSDVAFISAAQTAHQSANLPRTGKTSRIGRFVVFRQAIAAIDTLADCRCAHAVFSADCSLRERKYLSIASKVSKRGFEISRRLIRKIES